jgi:hypothetical protein
MQMAIIRYLILALALMEATAPTAALAWSDKSNGEQAGEGNSNFDTNSCSDASNENGC